MENSTNVITLSQYEHGASGAKTGLRYWPELKAVEIQLIGAITTPENIIIHNEGLEQIERFNAISWLVDARTVAGFSEEFEQYMADVWMKRALPLGVRFMAVVVALDAISEMAVESTNAEIMNANNTIVSGYELVTFGDMEEAMNWIREKVEAAVYA